MGCSGIWQLEVPGVMGGLKSQGQMGEFLCHRMFMCHLGHRKFKCHLHRLLPFELLQLLLKKYPWMIHGVWVVGWSSSRIP